MNTENRIDPSAAEALKELQALAECMRKILDLSRL